MTRRTTFDVDVCYRDMRVAFLEQPGLHLTVSQAQRLWGLGRLACERALYELVCDGFLVLTVDGQFRRPDYTTFDD
jgi:hypothetical protein